MTRDSNLSFEAIDDASYEKEIEIIEEQLEERAVTGSITVNDGMELSYEFYKTENAQKSVVIVHGFSEFTKKFSEMCWYFLNAGYNVFLYDQRGHGMSGREVDSLSLGHVNSYDDYALDLEAFIDRVVKPNADGTDIYIYSHSMGGMVALLYLMKRSDAVKKAVLSSPMIRPGTKGMPAFMLKAIVKHDGLKYGWDNKFRFAAEFDPHHEHLGKHDECFSRFKHNLDCRIANGRYQNSSSTNRWMYESLSVHKKLLDRDMLSKISCKVMIVNAQKDRVVRRSAQKKLAKLANFRYVSIKGAKHSIFVSSSQILNEYYRTIFDFYAE